MEHAYQSLKTGTFDETTYNKYNANYKKNGKLGKIAGNGRANTAGDYNITVMENLIRESFAQNPAALVVLQATGDRPITHTQDKGIWAREFPRILMKIRDEGTPAAAQAPVENRPFAERVTVVHSGGALGADTVWQQLATEAGVEVQAHSYEGHARNNPARVENTAEELAQADTALRNANKTLRRSYPPSNPYVRKLLQRNYYQVKDSDMVLAVSRIKDGQVEGGTAWATQMGVDMGKPVYVFDMTTNQWHAWDGQASAYVVIEAPVAEGAVAGIGSREMTPQGMQAIRDIVGVPAPQQGARSVVKTTREKAKAQQQPTTPAPLETDAAKLVRARKAERAAAAQQPTTPAAVAKDGNITYERSGPNTVFTPTDGTPFFTKGDYTVSRVTTDMDGIEIIIDSPDAKAVLTVGRKGQIVLGLLNVVAPSKSLTGAQLRKYLPESVAAGLESIASQITAD